MIYLILRKDQGYRFLLPLMFNLASEKWRIELFITSSKDEGRNLSSSVNRNGSLYSVPIQPVYGCIPYKPLVMIETVSINKDFTKDGIEVKSVSFTISPFTSHNR